MSTTCTRCEGTGFLNLGQVPSEITDAFDESGDHSIIAEWIDWTDKALANPNHCECRRGRWCVHCTGLIHAVAICDCCGNGEEWHGTPGEHYGMNDPKGNTGPYAYNGGLCECH